MAPLDMSRRSTTKADAVFDELRRQLIDGERPWGQTFSTYELAEEFQVSRRPVMDAVARLAAAGFIEIERQVGCRVVAPTPSVLRDHIEYTAALHSYAVRLAAVRFTDRDRVAMEAAYDRLDVAVATGDLAGYDQLNSDFHDTVVRASGNRRLELLTAEAWDLTRFFRSARPAADLPALQVEHRDLVDAIVAGDAATAQRVIETHQLHALVWAGLA